MNFSQFLRLTVLSIITLSLAACSGGSSETGSSEKVSSVEPVLELQQNSDPVIGRILTDIRHLPDTYGGVTNIDPPPNNIAFTVNVNVSDPDGFDDLEYIDIFQVDDDWFWTLLDDSWVEEKDKCRIRDSNVYECVFYSDARTKSIRLSNWKIIVEDKSGNRVEKQFHFSVFGGEEPGTSDIVYASKYDGETSNAIPALESLSEEANGLEGSVIEGTASYRIEFLATDARINSYLVELWAFSDK